jgi:hypothetical protein
MSERVVLDTNVFVAALKSGEGASRAILRLCLRRRCQPLMGVKLFAETEDVLGRSDLFRNSPVTSRERNELLDAFLSVCEAVHDNDKFSMTNSQSSPDFRISGRICNSILHRAWLRGDALPEKPESASQTSPSGVVWSQRWAFELAGKYVVQKISARIEARSPQPATGLRLARAGDCLSGRRLLRPLGWLQQCHQDPGGGDSVGGSLASGVVQTRALAPRQLVRLGLRPVQRPQN